MMKSIDGILNNYNIGNVEDVNILTHIRNVIARVKASSGTYYLKIYTKNITLERMNFMVENQNFLASTELNVESIVKTNYGDYFGVVDNLFGFKWCVLTKEIAGTVCEDVLEENQAYRVGKLLAKLHTHLDNINMHEDNSHDIFKELFEDPLIALRPYLDNGSEASELIAKIMKNTKKKVIENNNKLDSGICHGDFHCGNIIFNSLDEAYLIDFEYMNRNFRLYDIATLIWSFLPREDYSDETIEKVDISVKEFFKGYLEKRSLNEIELSLVYNLAIVRHIWRMAHRVCNGQNLSKEVLEIQVKRLRKWIEIYDISF